MRNIDGWPGPLFFCVLTSVSFAHENIRVVTAAGKGRLVHRAAAWQSSSTTPRHETGDCYCCWQTECRCSLRDANQRAQAGRIKGVNPCAIWSLLKKALPVTALLFQICPAVLQQGKQKQKHLRLLKRPSSFIWRICRRMGCKFRCLHQKVSSLRFRWLPDSEDRRTQARGWRWSGRYAPPRPSAHSCVGRPVGVVLPRPWYVSI